ncbi:hypothetical protein [Sinorhizobium meliloti]|uniref:hypothetical protein n=1 Tax=Rhizobium meliloti TaxID=382 RepID=UPI00129689BC|nr:hypothetical protein [Sinorhizobium meliloti]MQX74644.1 hypothetical protein [Sinorhizobium meliloti]
MSTARACAHSNVVSLVAERERRFHGAEDAPRAGTKSKSEIINIPNRIEDRLSPIVPEVRTSKAKPSKSRKSSTPKVPSDEQYSIEQIGAVIRELSDKELKARFPVAWIKHDSLKRKTRKKHSWDQLHPAFAKFRNFLLHLGPTPHPDSTLERPDINNPVYGPGLCHWANSKEQANNRSTNVWITWCGERHTLAEWADLSGIPYGTLKKRHQRRWTEARMFADAPVHHYRTAPASLVPPPLPAAPGTYTYNVGPIPLMSTHAKGWPEGFVDHRQYESGFIHATRQKGVRTSMTRAHFGAWIAGSKLKALQRQIDAAGLSGYVFHRAMIPADGIADIDRRACACPAIREYYALRPFYESFVEAYLAEGEIINSRRSDPSPFYGEGLCNGLRELVKRKPCSSPDKAWNFFAK